MTLRAAALGTSGHNIWLRSLYQNSLIVCSRLPMMEPGALSYNTLIDSGASRPFIDVSIAEKHPENATELESPLVLELFDGQPSSAGEITHLYRDTISFEDGTIQVVTFYITKLHPTAPIVLGLSWLRDVNPIIDWKDLTVTFWEQNIQISAAMAGDLVRVEDFASESLKGGVKFPNSSEIVGHDDSNLTGKAGVEESVLKPQETLRKKSSNASTHSIVVEEILNEDLEPANKPIPLHGNGENGTEAPILMAVEELFQPLSEGLNDWLDMAQWNSDYIADSQEWLCATSLLHVDRTSEVAWKAWLDKRAQRSSAQLPQAKLKKRWRYKRMDHPNTPTPPLKEDLEKFQKRATEAKKVPKGG